MFEQFQQHIQYVIVAHTYHRPYVACIDINKYKNINSEKWLQSKLNQTSKDLRHALNCFNQRLYPNASNKCKRNPLKYRPLTFVTIEGAKATIDRQQTIHVNIAIGNLPTALNADEVESLFRHVWHEKAQQSKDVKAIEYFKAKRGKGWLGYSVKEAQQQPCRTWTENSIWDVTNCWIPHNAFNAD